METEQIEPAFNLRKPSSLRSHVESFLREAIMSGRFQPGERLRERELCEMLDVSRPSLREALRILEAEKLIKTVLHRGPVVAAITADEARELYAVRALLESHAVHEFTRLADDAAVARLGEAVDRLHAAAAGAGRKQLLAAKAEFYDAILNGCGNQLIKEMLLALLSRINLLRATSFSRPDRLAESLAEIDRLFALIQARNAGAAREAARMHIVNAEQAALAVLARPDSSTPPPLSTLKD
ncbi:MAG TPA: GntR family transcriptional regulator [Burkholderiaceae bacterium]|nr:GntR family transcriptional regulator [Burkholderiaceae bacterium]